MISLFQCYRVAAAYLILLIHQSFWPGLGGSFTGVAVPLFAAMAGCLVVGDRGEGGEQVRGERVNGVREMIDKKARRILLPYAIWAVIYFVMNRIVLDVCIRHEAFAIPPLRSWLLGGTACHLWFLPCLFVMFVVAIGVQAICCNRKVELIIWGLLFIASAATQWLPGGTSAALSGYVRIYFGRLMFYFALGVLLRRCTFCAMPLTCGLILIGFLNLHFNWISGLVFQPALLVVGLILLAVRLGEFKLPKAIDELSMATMGIYLVHVLFTSAANFVLNEIGYSTLPIWGAFPLTVLLFSVSYLCARLLPKWMRG